MSSNGTSGLFRTHRLGIVQVKEVVHFRSWRRQRIDSCCSFTMIKKDG